MIVDIKLGLHLCAPFSRPGVRSKRPDIGQYTAIMTEKSRSTEHLHHGQKKIISYETKLQIHNGHERPKFPTRITNEKKIFAPSCLIGEPAI